MLIDRAKLIEAHELVGFQFQAPNFLLPNRESSQEASSTSKAIPLVTMWHRGRFEPSLIADSPDRSRSWRDEALNEALSMIEQEHGITVGGLAFWREIARFNGCDKRGIQQNSGMKRVAFDDLVSTCLERDLLFYLEEWQSDATEEPPRQLLYWTDPGLLNHLLDLREEALLDWTGKQPESIREQQEFIRGKSWEGFAISALLRATLGATRGSFWQAPSGEIDLILDWRNSDKIWAVEMTTGRRKAVDGGFKSGFQATDSDRAMIVHPANQKPPSLQGSSRVDIDIEKMSLEIALKAVLEGPA